MNLALLISGLILAVTETRDNIACTVAHILFVAVGVVSFLVAIWNENVSKTVGGLSPWTNRNPHTLIYDDSKKTPQEEASNNNPETSLLV